MRLLVGTAALALVACDSGKLPTYRYRMTVEVDTPTGLRTGSSVIEVRSRLSSRYSLSPGSLSTEIWGEAAAVDLPSGDTVYALLSQTPGDALASVFALNAIASSKIALTDKYSILKEAGRTGVLPFEFYPYLVRFRDRLRPETVEEVKPHEFDQYIGHGYALKRIIISTTDAKPTSTLQERLPWLDLDLERKYRTQRRLDRNYKGDKTLAEATAAEKLEDRDFVRRWRQ